MTTLNDVKIGDTVFFNWYGTFSYVKVVRLTNTQIVVRASKNTEYRFHKKSGEIAHGGYDDIWCGKPKISVRTEATDKRFAAQQEEQSRRLMIGRLRDIAFDKLTSEQLERILEIVNEVTK